MIIVTPQNKSDTLISLVDMVSTYIQHIWSQWILAPFAVGGHSSLHRDSTAHPFRRWHYRIDNHIPCTMFWSWLYIYMIFVHMYIHIYIYYIYIYIYTCIYNIYIHVYTYHYIWSRLIWIDPYSNEIVLKDVWKQLG